MTSMNWPSFFAAADHTAELIDPPPPPADDWLFGPQGNESGFMVQNSATEVELNTQSSDDLDNGLLAYQLVASGDIQIVTKVPSSWTGNLDDFTIFGLQIREGLTGQPVYAQIGVPNIVKEFSAKYRLVTDTAHNNNYATSAVVVLPEWCAITYNDTTKIVKYWVSPDGVESPSTWNQVGADLSLTFAYPLYVGMFGTSQDINELVQATFTDCALTSSITITEEAGSSGPRALAYELTYAGGEVLAATVSPREDNMGSYTCLRATESMIDITNITRDSPATFTTNGTHGFDGDGGQHQVS